MKRDLDTSSGKISSDSLCTPPEIATPLAQLFGGPVDIDPATNEHSIIQARRIYTWGGLMRPWVGPRKDGSAFVNWPYSTNDPWAAKALHEMKIQHVRELVILCMSATSTRWWAGLMINSKRNPRVMCTKRIPFLGPNGVEMESGARFDTALIYYGPRSLVFDREFKHQAMWSTWGR